MTPSERNDIARQLERLADEVKDLKMGLSAHKPVYTNAELRPAGLFTGGRHLFL